MDADLRNLERRHKQGDPEATEAYRAALLRRGYWPTVVEEYITGKYHYDPDDPYDDGK